MSNSTQIQKIVMADLNLRLSSPHKDRVAVLGESGSSILNSEAELGQFNLLFAAELEVAC